VERHHAVEAQRCFVSAITPTICIATPRSPGVLEQAVMAVMERFVNVGEARLWTVSEGVGPAVLLFNGGPGCDDYLGPVAAMMTNRCQVIRFEPRGCGRSTWDGRYELGTTIGDAEAIRAAYGLERWILAGHSAGPNVALAYALQHRERALGIIGIAGGRMVNDREWSRAYDEQRKARGEEPGVTFHSDPGVNAVGNRDWKAFVQRPELFRALADLDLPCVFINAGDDIRLNWPTRQLARLLPRGRYVEIAGAGHYIWRGHAEALERELGHALGYILDGTGTG
jgi:proline iminopeptidase